MAENKVQEFFIAESSNEKNRGEVRFDLFMKKHKELASGNPNDVWKLEYYKNTTKLALMILLYIFAQDDDDISEKELKKVKKYLRKHRYILEAKDFDEIIELAKSKMTIDIFVKYMEDSGFKVDILDNAILEAKNVVKRSLIYKTYIDELKEEYVKQVK
jgi:hypothetical protein